MSAHVHNPAVHTLHDHTQQTPSHWRGKTIEFTILATISAVGLILGLADANGGAFSGLCLAIGAIFFGLSFITKALQKAEEAAQVTPDSQEKHI